MVPAVVISAYNRPASLTRLLTGLARADYPASTEIPLILSIDPGGPRDVLDAAQRFEWTAGPKQVLVRKEHLGLMEHFYACGDLSEKHEAVILLEDDLYVSPAFYHYAAQALEFYRDDPQIAGLCLYALGFNGYTQDPFLPLPDGADGFFLQAPYTQGLAFSRTQWSAFREWAHTRTGPAATFPNLHPLFSQFPPDEWFPTLAAYAVEADRFFVFPRVSLTTGFGDAGTHFREPTSFFQVALAREARPYIFRPLAQSAAVYDSFFEILPDRLDRQTDVLRGLNFAVDLYATKSRHHLQAEYVLTTRPCRAPRLTFGRDLRPMEANVIEAIPGEGIALCKKTDLHWGRRANFEAGAAHYAYFNRRQKVSRRLRLQYLLLRLWKKW